MLCHESCSKSNFGSWVVLLLFKCEFAFHVCLGFSQNVWHRQIWQKMRIVFISFFEDNGTCRKTTKNVSGKPVQSQTELGDTNPYEYAMYINQYLVLYPIGIRVRTGPGTHWPGSHPIARVPGPGPGPNIYIYIYIILIYI